MNPSQTELTRVVIVGGGAAALEAMLALRAIGGDRAKIDVYAPRDDYVLRPLAVTEAFGRGEVMKFDLREIADESESSFHQKSVVAAEPENRRVVLQDGEEVLYDYLVVATGTKSLWVVPGAKTFWGPDSQETVPYLLSLMKERDRSRIVLTMPDHAGWPLPIFELALYLASETRRDPSLTAALTIASPDSVPLEAFGERSGRIVSKILKDQGIDFVGGTVPVAWSNGELTTQNGSIEADAVVTLPRLTGRRIDGLPFNDDGFIPVSGTGLIEGLDREYAAGDVTSYPLKFGGFATGQADAVAGSIAAADWDGPKPAPFEPDRRATLLTPDGPVFLGESEDWSDLDQEAAAEEWNPANKIRGRYLSPVLTRLSRR